VAWGGRLVIPYDRTWLSSFPHHPLRHSRWRRHLCGKHHAAVAGTARFLPLIGNIDSSRNDGEVPYCNSQ